jgi:hypothetical protein
MSNYSFPGLLLRSLDTFFNPVSPAEISAGVFSMILLVSVFLIFRGLAYSTFSDMDTGTMNTLSIGLGLFGAVSILGLLARSPETLERIVIIAVVVAKMMDGIAIGAGLKLIAPYSITLPVALGIPVVFAIHWARGGVTSDSLLMLSAAGFALSLAGIYKMFLSSASSFFSDLSGQASMDATKFVAIGYAMMIAAALSCKLDHPTVLDSTRMHFIAPAVAAVVLLTMRRD